MHLVLIKSKCTDIDLFCYPRLKNLITSLESLVKSKIIFHWIYTSKPTQMYMVVFLSQMLNQISMNSPKCQEFTKTLCTLQHNAIYAFVFANVIISFYNEPVFSFVCGYTSYVTWFKWSKFLKGVNTTFCNMLIGWMMFASCEVQRLTLVLETCQIKQVIKLKYHIFAIITLCSTLLLQNRLKTKIPG